jgi:hypothetical protein
MGFRGCTLRLTRPTIRGQKGQDLVEFALIVTLLLLLLLGIMEFGLTVFHYNTIANAAREGARAGIVPAATDASIISAAEDLTTGLAPADLDILVSRPTARSVQVEVIYVHRFLTTPIIVALGGDGTLTLRTVSTMNIE